MKKPYLFIAFGITLSLTFGFATALLLMKNTPDMTPKTEVLHAETTMLDGQWDYMPGVTKTKEGLLVKPLHFALVEQNGVSNSPNPPINLEGTHLENIQGDFTITTTLNIPQNTKATIQLYGRTPIIADEFRLERESIRLEIENNKLTVSMWNNEGQTPFQKQNYFFTPKQPINLKITRQKHLLGFWINDVQVGQMNEYNLFSSGTIWFGLDSQGGEWKLLELQAVGNNGGKLAIKDAANVALQHNPQGLQTKASKKRPGFLVGTTVALSPLATDPKYAQTALDNSVFGSITPENDMKMINLQPQQGIYSFQKADAIVHFAKENKQKVHGHTLVFGEANPPWFNQLPIQTIQDKQKIEQIMKDHITTVVKHFGKDVMSWDVVNEPLADYDAMDQGLILRNHKWYQAMGEDYIVKALTAAHKANPDAILFINEYGLEENGDRWINFTNLLQRIKPKLQAAGVPADKLGVGFQAHVYGAEDKINPVILRQHIQQLAKLGWKTQISENDVYSDDGAAIQAAQYRDIFNACLSEPNCIRWNAWILSDRYDVWKDDDGQIYYGVDGLFGTDMKPRPAFGSIQNLLQ